MRLSLRETMLNNANVIGLKSSPRFSQQLAGDNVAHDLRCPFEDADHPDLAPDALDRPVLAVSFPARETISDAMSFTIAPIPGRFAGSRS
jgi:hypothetical protein